MKKKWKRRIEALESAVVKIEHQFVLLRMTKLDLRLDPEKIDADFAEKGDALNAYIMRGVGAMDPFAGDISDMPERPGRLLTPDETKAVVDKMLRPYGDPTPEQREGLATFGIDPDKPHPAFSLLPKEEQEAARDRLQKDMDELAMQQKAAWFGASIPTEGLRITQGDGDIFTHCCPECFEYYNAEPCPKCHPKLPEASDTFSPRPGKLVEVKLGDPVYQSGVGIDRIPGPPH